MTQRKKIDDNKIKSDFKTIIGMFEFDWVYDLQYFAR
jgi:hypothetical protein